MQHRDPQGWACRRTFCRAVNSGFGRDRATLKAFEQLRQSCKEQEPGGVCVDVGGDWAEAATCRWYQRALDQCIPRFLVLFCFSQPRSGPSLPSSGTRGVGWGFGPKQHPSPCHCSPLLAPAMGQSCEAQPGAPASAHTPRAGTSLSFYL